MSLKFTDSHAHLNFSAFEKTLEKTLKNAKTKNVFKIICVSSSVEDSKKAVALAKKYPKTVFASVGIHPQQTDPENNQSLENQIKELEILAKNNQVIAIGECGLDYNPAPPEEKDRSKEDQIYLFRKQVKLAKKLNLPLIIHCRKAFEDLIEILEKEDLSLKKGVFHCYAGGKKGIKQVETLGFYFGLTGNITYDEGLQNVFKIIPLEKILLETDSPYLSPIPKRNQENQPANIIFIAEFLARLKNKPIEEISKQTEKAIKELFNI